jgi:hypothetical protein
MRVYGKCAYNPQGTPEDLDRCIVNVESRVIARSAYQCSRPRTCGDGEEKLYCKQHYKMGPLFLRTAVPPDEKE